MSGREEDFQGVGPTSEGLGGRVLEGILEDDPNA